MNEKEAKRMSVEEVLMMDPAEVRDLYQKHLNFVTARIISFMGMNRRFVEAGGIRLRDDRGREYLDFISGFGALNLGHEPQEVLRALRLVEQRPNLLQAALNPFAAKLAECLAAVTPGNLSRSFFCNSGTEAVEAAIKLARISTGRKILIYTEGAYHGKTLGALSVSGRKKYKEPFEPLVPATEEVPYNDLRALEMRLARRDAAAFIVEPIQGENGVIVPQTGYLKEAEKLCAQTGTLLIADEIQTGLGRTGKLFCCDHENVVPDILVLSKSLGGGVMPLGAIVTRDMIWKKAYGELTTGLLHSSTFGGNTRACACGFAALQAILEKKLPERAAFLGEQLMDGLKILQNRYSILTDVRGRGLMIGLSFAKLKGTSKLLEGALTLWIGRQLIRRYGIITAFTLNNLDALRIAPPLIIEEKEIAYFLDCLEQVLQSVQKLKFFPVFKGEGSPRKGS